MKIKGSKIDSLAIMKVISARTNKEKVKMALNFSRWLKYGLVIETTSNSKEWKQRAVIAGATGKTIMSTTSKIKKLMKTK